MTEPTVEAPPVEGGATGSTSGASADDPLFVPVVNLNYLPEGVKPENIQGFVPDTPGNDKTLLRIKEGLESLGVTTEGENAPAPELPDEGTEEPPVEETPPTEEPPAEEPVDSTANQPGTPLF